MHLWEQASLHSFGNNKDDMIRDQYISVCAWPELRKDFYKVLLTSSQSLTLSKTIDMVRLYERILKQTGLDMLTEKVNRLRFDNRPKKIKEGSACYRCGRTGHRKWDKYALLGAQHAANVGYRITLQQCVRQNKVRNRVRKKRYPGLVVRVLVI
jgi:hypothetical protein